MAWPFLMVVVAIGVGACAQTGRPPVAERSPVFQSASGSYVVTPGDTLYSIAWRFGLEYRALARANDIRPPYTIVVGQRIRLAEAAQAPPARPQRRAAPPPARAPAVSTAAAGGWRPPTDAPVKRTFGAGNKGIDYALEPRHRVGAAAGGQVVYAGSGLGGFRHLVIVKHDASYLSAYSLDRPMSVREGQAVEAGELLADIREGGRGGGTLHFEIRRNGEPVDPGSLIGR